MLGDMPQHAVCVHDHISGRWWDIFVVENVLNSPNEDGSNSERTTNFIHTADILEWKFQRLCLAKLAVNHFVGNARRLGAQTRGDHFLETRMQIANQTSPHLDDKMGPRGVTPGKILKILRGTWYILSITCHFINQNFDKLAVGRCRLFQYCCGFS